VAAIDAQCDCPRWHSRPVGFVASDDEKKATRIAVESIPGVRTVNDHLTIPPAEIAMV